MTEGYRPKAGTGAPGNPPNQAGSGMTTSSKPQNHDDLLQFFAYAHLPQHLQDISKPFGDLAQQIVDTLPANPERTMALRKLLEAKDCAVRARLFK